jgi:hypothetical protein
MFVGTIHVEVADDVDEHALRKKVVAMLGHCGVSQVCWRVVLHTAVHGRCVDARVFVCVLARSSRSRWTRRRS